MRNCVKSCSEVKENENGKESGVSCHEEVVSDFNKRGFSALMLGETRLELFVNTVLG